MADQEMHGAPRAAQDYMGFGPSLPGRAFSCRASAYPSRNWTPNPPRG